MGGPWLLDTDHCIAYLSARSPVHVRVVARINAIPASDLYISTFSALELSEGPFHAQNSQSQHTQQSALDALRSRLGRAPINERVILEFGRIRAALRKHGQVIGDMDIGIAATALVHQLTLVTHNTAHFQRIAGLQLDDWFI